MAFPILLSTRLWEEVFSFYSLHECSFIQAALLSAFLSGRSQTWRNLKHQKLEMRTSRNQTASPFVFRSTSVWGGGGKNSIGKGIPTMDGLHAKREKPLQNNSLHKIQWDSPTTTTITFQRLTVSWYSLIAQKYNPCLGIHHSFPYLDNI